MSRPMYILKRLIILLLIVFPFGELLRFDLGNNVGFKILDIVSGLSTVLILILNRGKLRAIPWQFFCFPLVGAIALLMNATWLHPQELLTASLYLFRWIGYAGIFFVIRSFDTAFKKRLVNWMILDGVLMVLLGFIQYFFYNSLKPYQWLGWDDHMYRLFSVFLDPNFAGGFFMLFFLFIGGLLVHSFEKPQEYKNVKIFKMFVLSRKQQIVGMIGILFLTLIAIFLTFSRSSLLMLLIGSIVMLILIRRKKIILILLAIMIAFVLIISPFFNVESINLFREASSKARLGNYASALTVIEHRPWFGVGFDAYRYAKREYNIQYGWVNAPSHADAGVDNSFLFVLVTTGVFGLIAYCGLWLWLLRRAVMFYRKDHNVFALIFLSSSAGLFMHAQFVNSLFFPEIMLWMWLIFGLMEKRE